jgi:4'-phosphopantetheinyl transferase
MELNSEIILPQHEVHLWTDTLTSEAPTIAEAKKLLSLNEINRAERFLREVDHDHYVVSHSLVRKILARYLGISPAKIAFQNDPFGKPHLDPSINPAGLSFNLSHSGDRMLLGLVRNARIGVDIEEIRPESASMDVAARFFTTRENEDLRSLSGQEQIHAFFNCWTRKEAYLKAVGCGLSASPKDCEVTLKPSDKPAILRQIPTEQPPSTWSLFHFSAGQYISAIAVNLPTPTLKQKSG